jgi:hypothetical protein
MGEHHSREQDGLDALEMLAKRENELAELKNKVETLMDAEASQFGFGASGEYPDGKLTECDEGEITFGVAAYGSQIMLNFGKPVVWFAMNAEQADALGSILKKKAEETRKYLVGNLKSDHP